MQGVTRAYSTQMEQVTDEMSEACDLNSHPFTGFLRGLKENIGAASFISGPASPFRKIRFGGQ